MKSIGDLELHGMGTREDSLKNKRGRLDNLNFIILKKKILLFLTRQKGIKSNI